MDDQIDSSISADGGQHNSFITLLTNHQSDLRAFLLASLGSYADAVDVLQQTNLALWKKASQFRHDAEFLPWAFGIARYELLAFLRKTRNDRHVFSLGVAELMAETAETKSYDATSRLSALRDCLGLLSDRNRELVQVRYFADRSIRQVAEITGRSENAIKSHFTRLRSNLAKCIERRVRQSL